MVKRWLIIGLCSILAFEAFFPDVDLSEFSHLPDLMAHYYEHQKTAPDISFLAFLRLHYGNPDHLASYPDGHQRLPFSKRQHHRDILLIAADMAFLPLRNVGFVLVNAESILQQFFTNSIVSVIWQPPRP